MHRKALLPMCMKALKCLGWDMKISSMKDKVQPELSTAGKNPTSKILPNVFGCTLALSLYKCIQIEMLYYY
ncbi:hypothetical protein NECAME_14221 [Necator americanus]|uniref:Uncharacterized protein n=1 Tax=Necator americanus TaxID=51031 RepID=W2SRE9_NECAM|nr:hypothetical protein NECAME_14221 [Necator americanus]ETN71436.1 hypothetical protein NECAME_14221 [Necator americanus]